VPDAHRQDAAETIKILIALIIPNELAFAPSDRDRFLIIIRDCWKKKFFMFANGLGNRRSLFWLCHMGRE